MSGHLSMDSVLRNNSRLLLKNKKNAKKQYFKGRRGKEGKIEVKELSKEDLLFIQTKIIKEHKKEKTKLFIVSTLVLIPIIWFMYSMYSEFIQYKDKEIYNIEMQKQNKAYNGTLGIDNGKLSSYKRQIINGDTWIENKNWRNAIYFYEKAVDVYPEKYEANYRLALAYSYRCQYENIDCDKGKKLNEKLLKYFPDDAKALHLKSVFDKKK